MGNIFIFGVFVSQYYFTALLPRGVSFPKLVDHVYSYNKSCIACSKKECSTKYTYVY